MTHGSQWRRHPGIHRSCGRFGSASGTYNGKRGLVPGNRIEMPAAWRAVVENGKVKLWQAYADWTEGSGIINENKEMG